MDLASTAAEMVEVPPASCNPPLRGLPVSVAILLLSAFCPHLRHRVKGQTAFRHSPRGDMRTLRHVKIAMAWMYRSPVGCRCSPADASPGSIAFQRALRIRRLGRVQPICCRRPRQGLGPRPRQQSMRRRLLESVDSARRRRVEPSHGREDCDRTSPRRYYQRSTEGERLINLASIGHRKSRGPTVSGGEVRLPR